MSNPVTRTWNTPREQNLGLRRIANQAGLSISVLPNGSVFAIEHRRASATILVNQVLSSPLEGGIGRILLRVGGPDPFIVEAVGPRANISLGLTADRVVWEGETGGIRHRITLRLQPEDTAWSWQVQAFNARNATVSLDVIFVQDIGLGPRGFLANNEAYASQYI